MKKIFAVVLITLSLGGCAGTRLGDFIETVKSATTGGVSPEAVYIAANTFDAVEISATNYLNLKRCPQNAPFCRDPVVTKQLIPLIRAGRVARNNAVQWVKDHPNQLAETSLYEKLTTVTSTIQEMMRQYHIGG